MSEKDKDVCDIGCTFDHDCTSPATLCKKTIPHDCKSLKCPHCGEPLVIRAFYEEWVEYVPTFEQGEYLATGDQVGNASDPRDSEQVDWECGECGGSLKDYIGSEYKDLPKSMRV